jgi:hypothetical protein
MGSSYDDETATEDVDLSAIADVFDSAPPAETKTTHDEPPDGDYEVIVERCGLKISKGGNPMVSWMFRIEGPAQIGRCLFRHDVLSPADPEKLAKKVGHLRTDFHRLGIQIATAADLKAKVGEAVGVRLKVRKRTKNGYTDIFINGLVASPIDDGVPF